MAEDNSGKVVVENAHLLFESFHALKVMVPSQIFDAAGNFPSNDDGDFIISRSVSKPVNCPDPITRRPHHSAVGALE